ISNKEQYMHQNVPTKTKKAIQSSSSSTAIEVLSNENATFELLLIEDNPDVVRYLSSCLADQYRLHIAYDGKEGIEIAHKIVPDLIISDVMMPKKDGFEVCKILKQDQRTSHIPIIMLTAKADIESKLEGIEQGADAYLAKPFQKEELLLRIRKLLELRQQLQKHYLQLVGVSEGVRIIKDIPKMKLEDEFVQKVREVVNQNLDNFDFSVEQLCREIGMSNSQLHRKLSALTGYSATKFIRYIRLNRAKVLLQNPDLTITAVAFDTGFNDPSYFGRVFKKEFGVTPMEWRGGEIVER
ncbi:MAG: response regulator, partial [Bacteroidota bacterium]